MRAAERGDAPHGVAFSPVRVGLPRSGGWGPRRGPRGVFRGGDGENHFAPADPPAPGGSRPHSGGRNQRDRDGAADLGCAGGADPPSLRRKPELLRRGRADRDGGKPCKGTDLFRVALRARRKRRLPELPDEQRGIRALLRGAPRGGARSAARLRRGRSEGIRRVYAGGNHGRARAGHAPLRPDETRRAARPAYGPSALGCAAAPPRGRGWQAL